jgi:alkylation response protein AidB-like acyl-CoA dehydrogenase
MTTITDHPTTTDWMALAAEAAEDLRAGAAAADASGALSPEAYHRLRDLGITRALVPTEFGGGGATHHDMGQMLRILATGDPSVAVTLSMHSHLVAFQLWRHRHGQDASPVFSKVVDGAILVSTGASDWIGSNGTTTKVDGGYRVTARKSPASGCEIGTIAVTSARSEDAPDGPSVIHCAIPMAAEGVSIEETWDTVGLRATGSHTIVFRDVFVPDAAVSLVRPADVWHPVWNIVIGAAMPLITAAYVGIADRAVGLALEAAAGTTDPALTQLVGEMLNQHTIAVDVTDAMFVSADDLRFANSDEHSARTLSRKTAAADAAIATVELAMTVVGGRGFCRTDEMARLLRDVHGVGFHPLPRHRQRDLTGRVATGQAPVG